MKQGALYVHCVCLCVALEGPEKECSIVGTTKHHTSMVPNVSSLWLNDFKPGCTSFRSIERLLKSRQMILFALHPFSYLLSSCALKLLSILNKTVLLPF